MATNNSWIADTVGDFIHSPVWTAPIHTFIEAYCAAFDYDDEATDENDTVPSSSVEEQTHIHQQYQRLADSLINGLGQDLSLDKNELKQACQLPTTIDDSTVIDESYEQLYSARDFQLFQEMMRRKNLILQLQALVSLQLQWGLLKPSDGGDDLVLSLLLQATTTSSRRGSVNRPSESIEEYVEQQPIEQPVTKKPIQEKEVQDDNDDDDDVVVVQKKQSPRPSHKKKERIEPRKPPKEEYRLPNLRTKHGSELSADWYRELHAKDQQESDDENVPSKRASTPQTIGDVSEQVLREKLRELTIRTAPVDDETAAAMKSRKDFLQQQRDLILSKQRAEREKDLIQQTHNTRPQSAVHVARKAMATTNKSDDKKPDEASIQISDDELKKRRAMMEKLKRNVVDRH